MHPTGWLFSLDAYLDQFVLGNEFINFNIGLLTKSVNIKKDDLVKIIETQIDRQLLQTVNKKWTLQYSDIRKNARF